MKKNSDSRFYNKSNKDMDRNDEIINPDDNLYNNPMNREDQSCLYLNRKNYDESDFLKKREKKSFFKNSGENIE